MSLTTATIQSTFAAIRNALPCATTTVRHNGSEYSGTRATSDYVDQYGNGGAIQGVTGAVRLLVSDLASPHPKAGDTISVVEPASDAAVDREVISARYDQAGATLRLDYGERHG